MRLAPTKLVCAMRLAAVRTEQRSLAARVDVRRARGRSAPLNSDRDRDRNEPLAASHPPREALRGQLLELECGSVSVTRLAMSLKTGSHPG